MISLLGAEMPQQINANFKMIKGRWEMEVVRRVTGRNRHAKTSKA